MHADLLAHLCNAVTKEDVLRAVQGEHIAPVPGPLQPHFPPVLRLLQRAEVERGLHPAVPELRGVGVLIAVAGRRRERRRQDDIRGGRAVDRQGRVRAVAEQPHVDARLELFGALRLQHVGRLLTAREQPAQAVLRRGDTRALRDPAEDPREECGGRHVGRRLRARLTVGDPDFSECEPRPLADRLGERPRRASLGEPGPPRQPPEVREAVVAERCHQVELIEQVERRLSEVGLSMDHRLVVERRIAQHGVRELERRRCDERAADLKQIAVVLAVQVLPQRNRPRGAGGDRVVQRAGQVMIDLVGDDLPLDHPTAEAHVRG